MFKKLKTVMMIMFVIGMTMLMSSAGCDNAADSGGGGSSGGGSRRQPILRTKNGSTLTITHDTSKGDGYGTFIMKIVSSDKNTFPYSEISGTFELDPTRLYFDPNAPSPLDIKFTVSSHRDVSMSESFGGTTGERGSFHYDSFVISLWDQTDTNRYANNLYFQAVYD